jgi:hypothetical protein
MYGKHRNIKQAYLFLITNKMKKITHPEGRKLRLVVSLISFLFAATLLSSCSKDEMAGPASNETSADRKVQPENAQRPSLAEEYKISPPMPDGALIYVAHGACFGRCPVYQFTLTPEGVVRYEGIDNVKTIGTVQYEVSPSLAAKLASEMSLNGFLLFENFYPTVIDAAQTITGLRTGKGDAKVIVDYGSSIPDALPEMRIALEKNLGITSLVSRTQATNIQENSPSNK